MTHEQLEMERPGCRARYALLVAVAHAQTAAPSAAPSAVPTALPTAVPTALPTGTPSSAPTVSPQPTPAPVPVPTHVPTTVPTAVPSSMPSSTPTAAPSASPTITKAPTPDDDDEAAWCDFLGKKNCARRRTTPWLFYGAPAAVLLCLGACALAVGARFARRRRRDAKIADAGPRVRERVKPPAPAEPYRAVAFRWE